MTREAAEALALAIESLIAAEARAAVLEQLVRELRETNQRLELRLRVVDLMEQESARRLGIGPPPLRSIPDEHSVRAGDPA